MNYIINYLKVLVIPLLVVLLMPLLLAIINILGIKTHSFIILAIMVITTLISGFLVGRKAPKRGYINGLVFGLILALLLFGFSLFSKTDYSLNTVVYYLIIIITSAVGSMIGIQKKSPQS